MKKEKVEAQNKLIDGYLETLRALLDFVTKNFLTGLIWTGKEETDLSSVISGSDATTPSSIIAQPQASPQKEEKKVEQAKPKPAGGVGDLFSQINQKGDSITQGLKKAEKNKDKPAEQVTSVPVVEPKTTTTTYKSEKNSLPTQPAKKSKVYFNFFVENFVNDQTITITEEEASIKDMIKIDNCVNCSIKVDAKVKGIILNNCRKVMLVFKSVISNVDIMYSKSIEVWAQEKVSSILVDSCESVRVTLPKDLNTDVVSSKVTALNVTYLNDAGEYEKDFPVTDQFVTRWDAEKKRFVTKPMDLFL